MWQGELAIKNVELVAASQEAEKLLKDISESTTVAEKEKAKVAVILDQVSKTASVRSIDPHEETATTDCVSQRSFDVFCCGLLLDATDINSEFQERSACCSK